jgi:hypothetical protein
MKQASIVAALAALILSACGQSKSDSSQSESSNKASVPIAPNPSNNVGATAAPTKISPASANAPSLPDATTTSNQVSAQSLSPPPLDADMVCRGDDDPNGGIPHYTFTALKDTQVAELPSTISNMRDTGLKFDPMFCGKNIRFEGNMTSFVGIAGSQDLRSRIINVAATNFDMAKNNNPPLSSLGVVPLNEFGIVKSDSAKSGWINWGARLTLEENGQTRKFWLQDISFWLNRGGDNWLSFSVGKVREYNPDRTLGAEVPVTISLEQNGPNHTVTLKLLEKYLFHPKIKDDSTIIFVAN